jgi:hypothetical protein
MSKEWMRASIPLTFVFIASENLVAQYAPPLGHVHLAIFNR